VILLGAAFGVCAVSIMYVYAKSTVRFRAAHKNVGIIMTPLAIAASFIPLILCYGQIVVFFGGASHAVASAGMLSLAVIWLIGCVFVGLKFGPKKPQ
jgi:hypothetical protein